jgi:hypothetical protein
MTGARSSMSSAQRSTLACPPMSHCAFTPCVRCRYSLDYLSRCGISITPSAIYVEGCKIIEGELKRVEKAQQTDGR